MTTTGVILADRSVQGVLPANPLESIAALQDVLMVMSNGRIAVKRIPFAVTLDAT